MMCDHAADASELGTQLDLCARRYVVVPTRSRLRGLQHRAYLSPPLREEPPLVC